MKIINRSGYTLRIIAGDGKTETPDIDSIVSDKKELPLGDGFPIIIIDEIIETTEAKKLITKSYVEMSKDR